MTTKKLKILMKVKSGETFFFPIIICIQNYYVNGIIFFNIKILIY